MTDRTTMKELTPIDETQAQEIINKTEFPDGTLVSQIAEKLGLRIAADRMTVGDIAMLASSDKTLDRPATPNDVVRIWNVSLIILKGSEKSEEPVDIAQTIAALTLAAIIRRGPVA